MTFEQATSVQTSPQTLLKLAWRFPGEVLDNPSFQDILSTKSHLLKRLSRKTILRLLKQDRVPTTFLDWLSHSANKEILLSVAIHSNISSDALERLHQSSIPEVQEAAQLHLNYNDSTPQALEEILITAIKITSLKRNTKQQRYLLNLDIIPYFILSAFDEGSVVSKSVEHISIFPEIIKKLVKNNKNKVTAHNINYELSRNPKTPEYILEKLLLEKNVEIKQNVCNHPNLSADIYQFYRASQAVHNIDTTGAELRTFADSQGREVRLNIARHYHAPADILATLVRSTDWQFRLAVAFNLKTPIEVLEGLIEDQYWEVRWAVAQNLNTPSYLLEMLLKDTRDDVVLVARKRLDTIYEPPEQNSDIILASNSIPCDRNVADGIQRMEILSQEMSAANKAYFNIIRVFELSDIIREVKKGRWHSRKYILPPNTPIHLLEQLAESQNKGDRQHLASYCYLTLHLFEKLSKDECQYVRQNVAGNKNTPIKILEELSKDETESVCQYVADNPSTPIHILQELVNKDQKNTRSKAISNLREKILYNPNLSANILEYLAEINDTEIYTALARHPKTSTTTLHKISDNDIWQVRQLIAQNNNTSATTLARLV